MDEETIGQRAKRNRNTRCPECNAQFFSRKARHKHQMVTHRRPKQKPVMNRKKLVPAKELYG